MRAVTLAYTLLDLVCKLQQLSFQKIFPFMSPFLCSLLIQILSVSKVHNKSHLILNTFLKICFHVV